MGYGLTITARRDAALASLADELRAEGATSVVRVPADLADRDALADIVARHRNAFGSMNALILNAGVGTAGSIADADLRRIDKTLQVNFTAATALLQHALPMLRLAASADPARGAKIIGVASVAGVYAEPGLGVYGASKAALLSLLETLNAEESANGVTATALAPAYVDTDMAAWVADRVPVASMIPLEDVVGLVCALLNLSSNTTVARIVLARSGTSGYHA